MGVLTSRSTERPRPGCRNDRSAWTDSAPRSAPSDEMARRSTGSRRAGFVRNAVRAAPPQRDASIGAARSMQSAGGSFSSNRGRYNPASHNEPLVSSKDSHGIQRTYPQPSKAREHPCAFSHSSSRLYRRPGSRRSGNHGETKVSATAEGSRDLYSVLRRKDGSHRSQSASEAHRAAAIVPKWEETSHRLQYERPSRSLFGITVMRGLPCPRLEQCQRVTGIRNGWEGR